MANRKDSLDGMPVSFLAKSFKVTEDIFYNEKKGADVSVTVSR
jgi:hypothetical protein